jgi:multicomponent Na+:H+ antiporter subunit E
MGKDMYPAFRPPPNKKNPFIKTAFKRVRTSHILCFIILFLLWILLSGRFDRFHILLGLISSAIVTVISGDLMFTSQQPRGLFSLWLRWLTYIPYLMYQIFLANLHVMYLVFHPKMKELIDPQVIEFDSRLKSDYARTTFANSITLTPGTITVNATVLGRFSVHCIDSESGASLPGEMEKRIATVFRE